MKPGIRYEGAYRYAMAVNFSTDEIQHGLAAPLTSGYLRETELESRRAEGPLHAWTDVYLPNGARAEWTGFLPITNFIPAAAGINPPVVTPIDSSSYLRQTEHEPAGAR